MIVIYVQNKLLISIRVNLDESTKLNIRSVFIKLRRPEAGKLLTVLTNPTP